MRLLIVFSTAAALALVVAPAAAQSSDPNVRTCEDKSGAEAIAGCTAAIASNKLSPKNLAVTLTNRGAEYVHLNSYARAIVDFNEAVRLDPKSEVAFLNRGNAYFFQKDYAHAMADFNRAIGLNGQFSMAFSNRGQVYFMQGRYVRALADLNEAIRLNPKNADPLYARGLVKAKLGNSAGSKIDLASALALNPAIKKQFEYLKK